MTMRATVLALLVLLASLSGCIGLPGGEQKPAALYSLQAPTEFPGLAAEKRPWTLVVGEPSAASGLDTDKIAVRETPVRPRYYADARWAEPAPRMVGKLIVGAFENSDRLAGVGQSSVALNPKYRLNARLAEFEAVYPDAAKVPEARVKLDATLSRELGQQVVGSKTFAASREATSAAVPDVVEAYDQALDAILRDLVAWTLTTPPAGS
jgi:cholesterol transport system auxiliary component